MTRAIYDDVVRLDGKSNTRKQRIALNVGVKFDDFAWDAEDGPTGRCLGPESSAQAKKQQKEEDAYTVILAETHFSTSLAGHSLCEEAGDRPSVGGLIDPA